MTKIDRRMFLAGTLGLAGAVVLGACGDDDESGTEGTAATGAAAATAGSGTAAAGDLVTAKVGLLPITDVAPMFLATQRGLFAEHGLTVEPTFAAGGAVILPSVESGEFDIGYSNIVSLLLLQARGGSFKILAGGGLTATGDAPDYSEMIVLNDSPLQSMADVGGRRVAINTLKNALEIVVRESISLAGGDHESVQFVEVPFPEMAAALESGQVDAIQYNEPFQTIMLESGTARSIGRPFVDAAAGEILAFYFVKADNASSDVAVGFRDAMAGVNALAAESPDEVRAVLPEYTEIDPAIIEKLVMPPYVADSVRASSVRRYAELMTTYGLVDEMPDYEALLP
jgi:NitT/TauT family transport system substrate-binding protein